MLVSLTVGKVDAGVAVLLTEDKRLVCVPNCSSSSTQPRRMLALHQRLTVIDRVPFDITPTRYLIG